MKLVLLGSALVSFLLTTNSVSAQPQTVEDCVCELMADLNASKDGDDVSIDCGEGDVNTAVADFLACLDAIGESCVSQQEFTCDGLTVTIEVDGGTSVSTTASSDVVISIGESGGNSTSNGTNATATNTQSGGAALAVGGNGGTASSGGKGGKGTSETTGGGGTSVAVGGDGGGTKDGGDATAKGSTIPNSKYSAFGGDGGDAGGSGTEAGGDGGKGLVKIGASETSGNGGSSCSAGQHGTGGGATRVGLTGNFSDGSCVGN